MSATFAICTLMSAINVHYYCRAVGRPLEMGLGWLRVKNMRLAVKRLKNLSALHAHTP